MYTENDDKRKGKIAQLKVPFPLSPSLLISRAKVECVDGICVY